MIRLLAIFLTLTISMQVHAGIKWPRKIVKMECIGSMVTLDFIWDSDRSPFVPHVFVNGQVETGGTQLLAMEDGDLYSKPGIFSITLRPSDDKANFKKQVTIHDQYHEVDCEQKTIWDGGDLGLCSDWLFKK